MRLDRAMLFVKDLERMTVFYAEVVGLEPVEATRHPDWVEFAGGGLGFSLHAIPRQIAAGVRIASPPRPREQDPCKLTFTVDDLDGELQRLTGLGVQILHRAWGGWDAVDPEGNVFGVRQPGA